MGNQKAIRPYGMNCELLNYGDLILEICFVKCTLEITSNLLKFDVLKGDTDV